MGIINNNAYTTPQGDSITGTYISISDSQLTINRNISGTYSVYSTFRVWKNKSAKDAGNIYYDVINLSKKCTSSEITTGVYALMYAHLKTVYTNTSDDL
jgi:hypothetical protein